MSWRGLVQTTRRAGAVFAIAAAAALAPEAGSLHASEDAEPPAAEAVEANGQTVEAATAFVEAFTRRAFDVFAAETDDLDAQQTAFQNVLADGLAIDFLARIMLGGRKDDATAEQLAKYKELFPSYITRIYAEQIDEIAQKDLEIVKATKRGAKDVFVRSQFIRAADNTPIMVDWRVRRTNGGEYKVIDVSVRGVSIMLVKRDEFGAVINTLGFEALLTLMEEKIASPFGAPDVGLDAQVEPASEEPAAVDTDEATP